ncbi:MAG TPA: hypothetical protein VGB76_22475 [Pyrinomonadaceae bacterium]
MHLKAINGALHNFLETYASRYSDYDGYWIFGMLVRELEQFNIDLLNTVDDISDTTPMAAAVRFARANFKDQVEKAGLSLSCLREANLAIIKSSDLGSGFVNGHRSAGFDVSFVAKAVSHRDKTYERKKSVFVAPHDPGVEQRSTRRT